MAAHSPTKEYGFTIIEIVVVIALFTMVGGAVIALVANVLTGSNKQGILLSDTDSARRLSFKFASEIRNAVTANTGAYALEQATAMQIIFYANIDNDNLVERVRYYFDSGKVRKGIIKPTGSPLSYVSGNETISTVQNNVVNGSNAVFTYYDGNFTGSGSPLTSPVNVTSVKFVQINLRIANRAGISSTLYYTVTAGGSIRNLKTNLGS